MFYQESFYGLEPEWLGSIPIVTSGGWELPAKSFYRANLVWDNGRAEKCVSVQMVLARQGFREPESGDFDWHLIAS